MECNKHHDKAEIKCWLFLLDKLNKQTSNFDVMMSVTRNRECYYKKRSAHMNTSARQHEQRSFACLFGWSLFFCVRCWRDVISIDGHAPFDLRISNVCSAVWFTQNETERIFLPPESNALTLSPFISGHNAELSNKELWISCDKKKIPFFFCFAIVLESS